MHEREATATKFTRDFAQYREIVQREPIAVTSHGRAIGYFVSPLEYAEMQRLKALSRRSRAVVDLTEEEMADMLAGRMSAEHDHLNALLEQE